MTEYAFCDDPGMGRHVMSPPYLRGKREGEYHKCWESHKCPCPQLVSGIQKADNVSATSVFLVCELVAPIYEYLVSVRYGAEPVLHSHSVGSDPSSLPYPESQ
ncbi:hypothetical protein NDU88_006026 [Pleurodeles waltl]|uniref:Uncharacterized protein n=1 Tax=Pleurodeles waltl TaxID=8319 RepID=A0AAV7RP44_PLEWA|nr:hypothetical protein NDU88_006026 [Pleurodeles waltl]